MNNMLTRKFGEDVATVKKLLLEAEHMGSASGLEAITRRSALVDRATFLLERLYTFSRQSGFGALVDQELAELHKRFKSLPSMPRIEQVTAAQNILHLRPRFLAIDDVVEGDEPRIARIVVTECDGAVLYDQVFSASTPSAFVPHFPQELIAGDGEHASISLSQVWSELLTVVSGYYVLAYDLALAQTQLQVTARQRSLPVPILIGASVGDLCALYVGANVLDISQDQCQDSQYAPNVLQLSLEVPPSWGGLFDAVQRTGRLAQAMREMAQGTFALPTLENRA